MNRIVSKLRTELLDADLDLRLINVATEGTLVIKATSRPTTIRILIAAVFGIPCCYLLYAVASDAVPPHLLIQSIAVIFASVLGLLAILFGFTVVEKSFNRSVQSATKSIRFLRFETKELEPLPEKGVVRLSREWELEPPHWEYRVSVNTSAGLGFSIAGDYQRAHEFGRQLAHFLLYKFDNYAPEKSGTPEGNPAGDSPS